MAHTVFVFHEKSAVFSDLDALILIYFLSDEICRSSNVYPQLLKPVQSWKHIFQNYGPGVVEPFELEKDLGAVEARVQFLNALKRVDDRLREFGSSIPSKFLQSHIPITGVTFSDFDTTMLLKESGKIRDLLQ